GAYQGRFVAWLLVTICLGELLWILAGTERLGSIFSYRLYTIWAAVQVLATFIIFALLIDRWHRKTVWPVRQAALLTLPLLLWLLTRATPVAEDDVVRHLSACQRTVWGKTKDSDEDAQKRNSKWFE